MNEHKATNEKLERKLLLNLKRGQREWLRREAYKRETTMSAIVRSYIDAQIEASRKQAQQA